MRGAGRIFHPLPGPETRHAALYLYTRGGFNDQAVAQKQVLNWVEHHVPPNDTLIMDNYLWTDLHDPQVARGVTRMRTITVK